MPHTEPRKPLTTTERWPVRGFGEPGVDRRLFSGFSMPPSTKSLASPGIPAAGQTAICWCFSGPGAFVSCG